MGNEESFPIEENIISSSAIENPRSKSDLIKTKVSDSIDRKMSIGIMQKFPIFAHNSEKEGKDIAEDCSLSSGDMVSEDSPVTPPGLDLSHLSDCEREHIAHVIARAKQIERDEDDRIREIENELNFIEEAASSRGSRHSISPDGSHCEICSKQINSNDSMTSQKCVSCGRKVCSDCGIFTSDPGSTFADFLCSICQKKRYLVLSSGMWFHGLCHAPFPKTLSIQDLLQSPKKPKIERTASYSQYEDMLEKPRHDAIGDLQQKRTSLPSKFRHNSNPDMRNYKSADEQDLLDNDDFNGAQQQQINPEYQEVKNRYLQESNIIKSKSRRGFINTQPLPTKEDQPLDSPVDFNRAQDSLSFTVPAYGNYYQDKTDIVGQYNYFSDENYDFPLVEDIIDSDSSSEREDYNSYKNKKDDNMMDNQTDFPSVDEILDENVLLEDMVQEDCIDDRRDVKQSQYFSYANTTFKPASNYAKEELQQANYDPYDRHNSLMGYYEQYDNQFEDFFNSEEEFRAIENFQLYNNELIRRGMSEEEYYRQIDQSDTDSDIAKFAASIANDTANLTSQTVNLDHELSGYREHGVEMDSEDTKEAYYSPTYSSNLLTTEHLPFKRSILSPIQDLSPNSSRADDGKTIENIEEILSQTETCPIKCDHDSDEECPWCYKDSTSINSQERNSSLSLSSSSLSSKISSTSSTLSSNGTLNNKSKSQLKRCQNYENISGLSESASADTLEDNNLIQELNNDNNQDEEDNKEEAAKFNKGLSLSRQESTDIIPDYYDTNDCDNASTQNAKNLCSQTSFESATNENEELRETIENKVPFYAKSTYQQEDRNLYNERIEDREAIVDTTTKHQFPESSFVNRKTELLTRDTSDSRQSKFPSPINSVAENTKGNITLQYPTTLTALKNFPPITEYYSASKDTLVDGLCLQLQVPVQIKHRKSILNEEIRLVTQLRRKHLNDFVQIQNVELQLNHLRNIEKKQMTEIQEKLAEIQNVKCGLTYPQYSKSRVIPNYQDLNYYYYYPQRNYYRNPYNSYHQPQYHPTSYNYPTYKYDPNFDDQRSSYSIHSSPQYLNYGGSYPKELKYNTQYYIDPVQNHPRGYSRSTDQIAMYNYQNYPIELSHSDQGLVNMGYNYPLKVNDQLPYNIDMELMQKEQRVMELEREIELRKRQIEETIRYQEELLHLAELNNVAVADYNSGYQQTNNDQIIEYDQINDYYLNEKSQHLRQYPDDNSFYPYDNLPINPISQQQYASYYENMYQQTDPRDNVLYTEPIFSTDPYYQQRSVPKCDNANYYNKLHDSEMANLLDQQQHSGKYSSNIYQRFDGQAQDQMIYSGPQESDIERVPTNRTVSKVNANRPMSGEYENVTENEPDFVDNHPKQENVNRGVAKPVKKKDVEKLNKHYTFPTKRLLLMRDSKEKNLRGNGVGMRIIGGQLCSDGHLGAFVEEIFPGSVTDRLQDQIKEGDELIEWNGVPLIGKTFEDVRAILRSDSDEIEILVRVGSISKSTETSKGNSDASEPNVAKSVTSVYDNMNAREPNEPMINKKHPKFADESSSSRDTPCDRRSQSIKRQKAQEYDMALVNRTPPKVPSPTKEGVSFTPCIKDIDCGSPTATMRESPINPPSSVRQRLNSKEITPCKSDNEKEDQDIDKEDSASDKVLGSIQLIISFDDYDQSLTVHVAKAKHLLPMDLNGLSDPFVKIRLHPDPTEDPDYNRQTRYMPNTLFPEWQQTMVFMNILKRSLKKRVLDISVWDFDRLKANDFMGQALISLANKAALDAKPHWYKLTEQKEVDIPGLRLPSRVGTESKTTAKTKVDSKSAKEIKNPKDETKTVTPITFPSTTVSSFSPNMPKYSSTITIPSKLPEIKITKSIESSSPQTNPNNFRPARNPAITIMSEKSNNLVRADTADSKSSNSSSVTTDFLSEEQREIVRKWLGPGQLLMLSYTQRVDKVGNLPDDSLVVAELFLSLRKIADENTLIVSTASLINLKAKNTTEIYIKLYLMYSEQQLSRVMKRKTRPLLLSETNNFNQIFTFNTPLEGMLLQVSLWSCGKGLTVHKMLGEAVIHLDDIDFVNKTSKTDISGWYKLLKPDI